MKSSFSNKLHLEREFESKQKLQLLMRKFCFSIGLMISFLFKRWEMDRFSASRAHYETYCT